MNKPKKQAAVIKAWADGADVQWMDPSFTPYVWHYAGSSPSWTESLEWRVRPHLWQKEINARTEGKTIQFRRPTMPWTDGGPHMDIQEDGYEYRVKVMTIKYRNYIHKCDNIITIETAIHDTDECSLYFAGWVGDWQEVEV